MKESMLSQKPYLVRAIHDWCCDQGFTPFLAAFVDEKANVPAKYVQQGQIVLNLANSATKDLIIDNEWITFKATFNGDIHDIAIPVLNVVAIFAQENGQGMQFNLVHPDIEKANKSSTLKIVK